MVIACGAYYYYFVQSITDYYTIIYTPYNVPLAKVFGANSKLAQPELVIKKEKETFKSDEEAIEAIKFFADYWKKDCLHEAATNKERKLILEKEATAQFILMRFSHTRNIDFDAIKDEMIKNRSVTSFKTYCKQHKLDAKFYTISIDEEFED